MNARTVLRSLFAMVMGMAVLLILLSSLSAACAPTGPTPTRASRPALSASTLPAAPTSTLAPTQSAVATPSASPTLTPSPTITPTVRIPAAAPTASAALGTNVIIPCNDAYPGLPGCLRENGIATGRLAFEPSKGAATVVDLGHGDVWTLPAHAAAHSFSPSGAFLLLDEGVFGLHVARFDGTEPRGLRLLFSQAFWAPLNALPGAKDWLAGVTPDGGLVALPFPEGEARSLLPAGTLNKDGTSIVRWSNDGWLAWTLGVDQLSQAQAREQRLYVRAVSGGQTSSWRMSADVRDAYYLPIDWAPGTRFILTGQGATCNSCWSWGVPLVAINADIGKITDLHAAIMLTPEAFAWNPKRPGLIALADGGSRYRFDVTRLMLLDVTTGKQQYLTDDQTSVFEPTWSPDGGLVAYAGVSATPNATGDGKSLEHTLDGRAIYVVNPQSGEIRVLTHPDKAIDSWPHWTADGTRLLYTRKFEDHTDVRVVSLDGKMDELLVTGLPSLSCYYGGCGWSQILAYYP